VSEDAAGEITLLLKACRDGDKAAFDALVPRVHDELRRMAHRQLRDVRPGQTLDTMALVNEAYLRLVDGAGLDWQNRFHFFGVTARVMRWIVVDHIRTRVAEKRGGAVAFTSLDPELAGVRSETEIVLAVNRAVEKLALFNERLARVVECRFFGGMDEEEIAAALGVSTRSVQRDWKRARAWLQQELGAPPSGDPA
jgi:RNA polymerase sigma factor (TIGR02999 family)